MKKLINILFLLIFSYYAFSEIPIGSWRTHLSYNQGIFVAIAENKVYCQTTGGLFEFNIYDNSIRKLDKTNGLSDVTVTAIKYIKEKNSLVIGYDNGNIDVIFNNRVINISDIKQKPIIGDKTINCIEYYDNKVYLGCGFGIVVIDIEKYEIKETYLIGSNATNVDVQSIAFTDNYIYAGTTEGIYFANLNVNLANYQNWSKDYSLPNFNKNYKFLAFFNNKLFAGYKSTTWGNDKLYVLENGSWKEIDTSLKIIKSLNVYNNKLIVCDESIIRVLEKDSDSLQRIWLPWVVPNAAVFDEKGDLWVADNYGGMVWKPKNNSIDNIIWIKPNGPYFNSVMNLDCSKHNLWATAGGITSTLNNQWRGAAIYNFKNDEWKTYTSGVDPKLANVYDVCFVKINPFNNNQVYFGSFGSGLIKITNGIVDTVFNQYNSPLETIIENQPYVRITGIDFDTDGNLWIVLSEVTNNLVVLKKDGSWKTYPLSIQMGGKKITGKILCSTKGIKWIILPKGGGICAFSENGTFDNINDDKFKKISIISNEGEVISNDIFCMKEDKNGLLWVGTAKGLVYYNNQEDVFNSTNFYAQRIKLPNEIEGQANYLFESEVITAIAIDGANRKWVGTISGGAFLMSEDCTKEIYHFTVDNSPLLSNTINDIAIDPYTGEVFFATDKGICSFRSTATEGKTYHSKVEIFPNPVKPDYNGVIAIRGLVQNAYVKITDIAGNLVYETRAEGGQAIWNGKTYNGNRAQTGVYLVFSTDEEGRETYVAKLLFVN